MSKNERVSNQILYYEVIEDLAKEDPETKKSIKAEVKAFFTRNWEDFGDAFYDHALFHSAWLILVRHENILVGTATLHKKFLCDKVFYNFKTDGVAPEFHSLGLLERMNEILFKHAYIDNIIKQRSLWFHMIFSTPNARILGTFAKATKRVYPDPFRFDLEKKRVPLPDDKIWHYILAYNKVDAPPNTPLSKEACVIDDRVSRWPHICYQKSGFPYYKDPIVNAFADHYLGYKEGKRRMIVMCACVSPFDVIRFFYHLIKKMISKRHHGTKLQLKKKIKTKRSNALFDLFY